VKFKRNHRLLVVGAGRAGVSALEEIRRQGFEGELSILHDETHPPYDRPGCAKSLLSGHARPQDLKMPIADGLDVDWHLGRRAVHLDVEAHTVITDTDEVFEYDGLVITSGAHPIAPPMIPVGEEGIHLLYGLDDSWGLRADLQRAQKVAVIGAGLTGSEVAYAVRMMARDCVLIDSKDPMAKPVGAHAAHLIAPEILRAGVELRTGKRVAEVTRGRRGGWMLTLNDGEEITVDLIVATTGERPDTKWLAEAPKLDITDGVLCDTSLRVLDATKGTPIDGVVAAGTVARWPNLQYSDKPARVGQWIAALDTGQAAARTLLASRAALEPVTHMPRFWSDQFGLRIQVCGVLPDEAQVSLTEMRRGRRDVARAGVLLGYEVDNTLVGLVAVNAPHAFTSMARAMIATRGAVAAASAPAVELSGRRLLAAVG
jgi:NADPH-dependent 2,4-dienoyl-CoA reductase/sulfur reductase-like enzyme